MAVKIKVCGLKHLMEIGIANELMPDYIGFVFAPKSRRFIAPEHAAMLRTKLNPKIKVIGVFVNESLKTVGMCADMVQLDAVQLHGNETEEYVCTLREYIRCDIINAFKVTDVYVIDRAVCSLADYIMLDGGAGDGQRFDWSLTNRVKRPYFLAGGLTAENVEEALNLYAAPYAVDVSSGVEENGVKDYRKMMKFIKAVREHHKQIDFSKIN